MDSISSQLASLGRVFGKPTQQTPRLKFEIRTNAEYIIYRGRPDVTAPQKLTGWVIVTNTETIDIKSIKISLQGKRRTRHYLEPSETDSTLCFAFQPASLVQNKVCFYREEEQLQSSQLTLTSGSCEFSFEFDLPGDACESIEGFPSRHPNYQIYQLEAVCDRPFPHGNMVAAKHVRVIRTVGPDPDELLIPWSVCDTWAGKILYEWNVLSKSLIYGDKVTVDFTMTLLKGAFAIGVINSFIREIVHVRTETGVQDARHPSSDIAGMWKEVYYTALTSVPPPRGLVTWNSRLGRPQQKFSLTFDLPKSLKECRQSVDSGEWIRISHELHIRMNMHSASGHVSLLEDFMPIRLYISPLLPIGDDSAVSTPTGNLANLNLLAEATAVAPPYESHTYDRSLDPFRDIDPSGFVTPAARSGAVTPTARSGASTPHRLSELTSSSPYLTHLPDQHLPLPQNIEARLQELQRFSHVRGEEMPGQQRAADDLYARQSYATAAWGLERACYASDMPPTYADATSSRPPTPYRAGNESVFPCESMSASAFASAPQSGSQD